MRRPSTASSDDCKKRPKSDTQDLKRKHTQDLKRVVYRSTRM